jgi:hypothetical protein
MSDITERLRAPFAVTEQDAQEAVAEITRLREENARLEASNKKLNADLFKQSELTAVTMTRCADLMPAQSAIVKLKEQQVEIERLREENARLREVLKEVSVCLDGDRTGEDLLFAVRAAAAADALEAQAKEIKIYRQTELTYVTRVADAQREYSEMQAKLKARIAELEAENKTLREALKPFADEEDAWIGFDDKERLVEPFPKLSDISRITVGDLRAASAARNGEKG